MKQKKIFFAITLIFIIISSSAVWAEVDIALNGSFSAWNDKPSLSDPTGDEISRNDIKIVKWYPNNVNGNLYLYAERLSHNNTDWSFSVYLTGDLGDKRADVSYKRASSSVTVQLYDPNNRRIWSASGKWGDSKNIGTKVEFYIPLSEVVSTTAGGYQIDTYFESQTDFAPDTGVITISSVSTAPIIIVTGAIVVNVLFVMFKRKHKVMM
jgi:hypothetical protein